MQQIKTAISSEIHANMERHIRTRVKEISKDKKTKGTAAIDYPIIQDSLCRFYIRYIPKLKTAYIEYQGQKLYTTTGEAIEIYCNLCEYIDFNLEITTVYTQAN